MTHGRYIPLVIILLVTPIIGLSEFVVKKGFKHNINIRWYMVIISYYTSKKIFWQYMLLIISSIYYTLFYIRSIDIPMIVIVCIVNMYFFMALLLVFICIVILLVDYEILPKKNSLLISLSQIVDLNIVIFCIKNAVAILLMILSIGYANANGNDAVIMFIYTFLFTCIVTSLSIDILKKVGIIYLSIM